jgi:L-ribulose-5-phosphate 3-epimerase
VRNVGVCSWSLRPSGPEELAKAAASCGVTGVQLALDPLRTGQWDARGTVTALEAAGLRILSGMMATRGEDYSTLDSIRATGGVRLDEHWDENLAAARANAVIARGLGVTLVTLHAGFLPHDERDPLRATMLERLRKLIGAFAEQGVTVGLETGQEDAPTLLSVLNELRAQPPRVNFDPANMILYGMGNPVEALRLLAPHVAQVHIKDAVAAHEPGAWGTEVPAGTGEVDWPAFLDAVRTLPDSVALVIEREAGEHRIDDIRAARRLIRAQGGW